MKKSIYIVLALLILGGFVWYSQSNQGEVISSDTVVKGDYLVEKGKKIVLANGASLTVEGKLDLAGELSCKDSSAIKLVVKDQAIIDGKIKCQGQGSGISLVVGKDLNLGQSSELVSDGNIQLVESADLLATTPEQAEKLYEEAGQDSGAGQRVGPLVAKDESSALSPNQPRDTAVIHAQPAGFLTLSKLFGINKAEATSHTVIIGGKITVPTPPPGVRRIVVFNFPTAVGVEINNLELTGPDGRPGDDDKGLSCTAKGKDGEDAFRFLAYAGNMTVNNFTLKLGSGGKGGDAETTKDCDPGVATGGAGGKSGNFKMIAGNEFKIIGAFVIEPGKGGPGGSAIAHGEDGGPSQKGGDATSTGGKGADNNKQLGISGTVAGTDNVQIGSVTGGKGGDATANPGKGGDGIGCNSKGGDGGKGTATGGKGGAASLNLAGDAGRTPGAEDKGGDGGNGDSHGGKGAKGGDCGPEGPGGPGGKGGDATTKPGSGGISTNGNGADGQMKNETGGDGGNGGDGCPEGVGGKGGKGNPPGKDGNPGRNLCVSEKQNSQTSPDQPSDIDTQPTRDNSPVITTVQVIQYNGKYIPISNQLHPEPGHETDPKRSCSEEHWHSFEGIVITTDKIQIVEPADPCGFGTTKQHPVLQIEI